MGLRNGRRPDHKVNIGVGKDNINDFARKYNLEIEDIYEALNQDTAKKIVFYNTSDYWSAVTGGYKLSIPHDGNIVFAVYRTDSPTESTQVLTGVSMDSTNVNVESVDKFSGYLLCATLKDGTKSLLISEDGTHWEAEDLPIRNIGGPQKITDAATKDYVDRILAGYSGYGERLAIFDNVEQMQTAELVPSQTAVTLGYHDVNDGGQGVYNIRAKQASDIRTETVAGEQVQVVGDDGSVIAIGDKYDVDNVLYVAECIDLNIPRTFDTVADLKNASLFVGLKVSTKGYYSVNDGGAAIYTIRAKTVSDVDDGGVIIFLDNGNVAEQIVTDKLNVLTIGLKRNDNTFDNGAWLQAFLDKHNNNLLPLYFPQGTYYFNTGITLNYAVDFVGVSYQKAEAWSPYYQTVKTSRLYLRNDNNNLITINVSGCTFRYINFESRNTMTVESAEDVAEAIAGGASFPYNRFHYAATLTNTTAIFASADNPNGFTATGCAFRGFRVGAIGNRLMSFNHCMFNYCDVCVIMQGQSNYFHNCSFTHSNYAIVTNGGAMSLYGCWIDMIGEHAITSDIPSITSVYDDDYSARQTYMPQKALIGYINGTIDWINKSAIFAKSTYAGLRIDCKFSSCGLLYCDGAQDDTGMTNEEKFVLYSCASVISIYYIRTATITAAGAPYGYKYGAVDDEYYSPQYIINTYATTQCIVDYAGLRLPDGTYFSKRLSPLYYITETNIVFNDGHAITAGNNENKSFVFQTRTVPNNQNMSFFIYTPPTGDGRVFLKSTGFPPNGNANDVINLTQLYGVDLSAYRITFAGRCYLFNQSGSPVAYITIDTNDNNAVKMSYISSVSGEVYVASTS